MASTTTSAFLLLAISASARPCKTIFFITSSHFPNNHNPPGLTFFITHTRSLPRPMLLDRSDVVSSVKTSIRERTMDVMSIVGAVLFGVGCGALTAATMYLFWSLFAPRRFHFRSDSEEDSGDEENDVSPRNDNDVSVAAATKTVPPSADEVDAMMK